MLASWCLLVDTCPPHDWPVEHSLDARLTLAFTPPSADRHAKMTDIKKEFVLSACICNYTSCDLANVPGLILCKGTNEFLCIEKKFCCSATEPQFEIGLIQDSAFLLKLGLPCCTCGLKVPDKFCLGQGQCLFCKSAAALPFTGPVPHPLCAICGLSILPKVEFLAAPPTSGLFAGGAPPAVEMKR